MIWSPDPPTDAVAVFNQNGPVDPPFVRQLDPHLIMTVECFLDGTTADHHCVGHMGTTTSVCQSFKGTARSFVVPPGPSISLKSLKVGGCSINQFQEVALLTHDLSLRLELKGCPFGTTRLPTVGGSCIIGGVPKDAVIKVYQPGPAFVRFRDYYTVVIDEAVVGELWPNQVKSFRVTAGEHRVRLKYFFVRRSWTLDVSVDHGQVAELACWPNWTGFGPIGLHLSECTRTLVHSQV